MQRLNLHPQHDDSEGESKVDDARRLQEEEIEITFELPDQSEARHKFKRGQTVVVLKSYLETEFDLHMPSIRLVYNDVVLLDPYSLTDYPDFEHNDSARILVVQSRK